MAEEGLNGFNTRHPHEVRGKDKVIDKKIAKICTLSFGNVYHSKTEFCRQRLVVEINWNNVLFIPGMSQNCNITVNIDI